MVASLFIFNSRNMLKSIITNIILVGITVFILDFAIGSFLYKYYFKAVSGYNYEITYALEKTNEDILIIGSSRALYHYIPQKFVDSLNMSCYNTGHMGSVLLYENAVLKSVLKRYVPKYILIDFYNSNFDNTHAYNDLSILTPYYATHEEIRDIVNLKSPFEKLKLNSKIYPFQSEIYNILRNTVYSEKRHTDNGYIPVEGVWQKSMDTTSTAEPYMLDETIIDAVDEFLTLAKNSGSQVVVIYSPMYAYHKNKRDIAFIRQLCSEKQIPFWNFSRDTTFLNHREYFSDTIHLNRTGSTIFTETIIQKLKEVIELN